jgi:hypothetical protein
MYFCKNNQETREIENQTQSKIKEFLQILNKNKRINKYVKIFGIIGPCARREGFYFNKEIMSDIDFYVITNFINLKLERILHEKFNKVFKNTKMYSILINSPTIFKKPDLMFFEFSNAGKILYGKKLKKININKIPRYESYRNLIYRSCFFLSLFNVKKGELILKKIDKELFMYYYSKVILSIGEVFLILTKEYVANNKQRNKLIEKNEFAKKIKGFIDEHERMQKFRETGKINQKINFNSYTKKGFDYLSAAYDILVYETGGYEKIKAKGITFFSNRILFTLKTWNSYKKIRIHISKEPFMKLTGMTDKLIQNISLNQKVNIKYFKKILQYWKTAGWLYIKK